MMMRSVMNMAAGRGLRSFMVVMTLAAFAGAGLSAVTQAQPSAPATPPGIDINGARAPSAAGANTGASVGQGGLAKVVPAGDMIFDARKNTEGLVDPDTMPSLFFTPWTYALIQEARKAIGFRRAPTQSELLEPVGDGEEKPIDPGRRELELGGIVFVRKDNWTIWFNGERMTPEALPPEIMDLQVSKEYIEVKWFDEYTNQIFPIRLRPHQRFNLDTRLFLPG